MEISFVIPAFNEEHRIAGCLQSVERELVRTPCDPSTGLRVKAEIIVVNNASSDRTGEIARTFPGVRVVDEPKKGLVQARHAGFVASTGELVANIDADTILPEGWLAKVLKEFRRDPKLVALSGPYIYYDINIFERALVKIWYFPGWLFHTLTQKLLGQATMLQGGNFVLRRDAWDKAGGFDTSIAFYGEDADVARRISKYGHVLWTWRLPMYTSGRRMRNEGFIKTGIHYGLNLFSTHITGRPWTDHYTDIR